MRIDKSKIKQWLRRCIPALATWTAMGRAWRYTAWGLMLAVIVTFVAQSGNLYSLLGTTAILGLLVVLAGGIWFGLRLIAGLPSGARGGMLLLVVPLVPISMFSPLTLAALYGVLLLGAGLIATGVVRIRGGKMVSGYWLIGAGATPLLAALIAFLLIGWHAEEPASWPAIHADRIVLPNPADPGPYDVVELNYGSGTDLHRTIFAKEADWLSESVDGSKLLDGWDGPAGWSRTSFWGFDDTELPVQGRVWMPDGAGPFPLVLIVHGNHEMSDFSDVGYGYLGELFASRGAITVSVDENFLNSSLSDLIGGPDGGLSEESDARGWMLLQHLVQWRRWTGDPSHPMFQKADLDRIVLIGHSRGGEAVSEAANFNRLSRYPDDGTLEFDFDFGIRGIIAIAPVDSQYHPRDRDTGLKDINFLVIHGSHDSDVDAFAGSAMYSRLRFEACGECFKASFYLVGANHGQFNTSWGRFDTMFPAAALLNVDPLMDPEPQRQVAGVVFSAFLEVVLHDSGNYRSFLARPEIGAHWFPDGASYLTNYARAGQFNLVNFEEDADLQTGSDRVEQIIGHNLALWKEAEVPLRWRDMDSAALLMGWSDADTAGPPSLEILLRSGSMSLSPDMSLSFSAAMGAQAPEGVEDFEVPETLDFEIELIDESGRSARLLLSKRRLLYPQVDPVLYKLEVLSTKTVSEVSFQRFAFVLHEWLGVNPDLDLEELKAIRFHFPAAIPASVWLDDVVISSDGI